MGLESREELSPSDHDKKDVSEALAKIQEAHPGLFRILKGGHWGHLVCSAGCCFVPISGSPRNPSGHAKRLIREADKCPRDPDDVQNQRRS